MSLDSAETSRAPWCTADPGPPQTRGDARNFGRSRVCGAPLRVAARRSVLRCARDTLDTGVGLTTLGGGNLAQPLDDARRRAGVDLREQIVEFLAAAR